MDIIVNGKQRRFLGGEFNSKPLVEIWLGDKKIWPSEGVARRIVVELPSQGTEDWQYWVHALDATRSSSTAINYMRFSHDGMFFYIQSSPDNTSAYQLEDNMLVLEAYDDGVLIDQLGEYLEVEAKISKRNGSKVKLWVYKQWNDITWPLPLLQGTCFCMSLKDYSSHRSAYSYFGIVQSLPSGVSWDAGNGNNKHNRKPITKAELIKDADVPDSDTSFSCQFKTSGGCYVFPDEKKDEQYAFPEYPAFTRKFKLKIISVS